MKKLLDRYHSACEGLVKAFCKKQGIDFDHWIGEPYEVGCFADYFFNMNDIVYDLASDQPKGLIIQWHDNDLEHNAGLDTDKRIHINYKSYAMGARYEQLNKQQP